jgi:hypothetical protein
MKIVCAMHIKEFLMKEKKFFVFGVTAVLLALGLTLVGCGDSEEGDAGSLTIRPSFDLPTNSNNTTAVMALHRPTNGELMEKIPA